jgi:hypothetical protein
MRPCTVLLDELAGSKCGLKTETGARGARIEKAL